MSAALPPTADAASGDGDATSVDRDASRREERDVSNAARKLQSDAASRSHSDRGEREAELARFDREVVPLTVIILTYNEAANIGRCLAALDWADDVVIVDSGSTDETQAAARAIRDDVRWLEHPFEDFGAQRNWALDHAQVPHPWVLFLDADEVCTPQLAEELTRVVGGHTMPEGESPVGYFLCCRNLFLGRWLKRTTLFPSWQLRLLRHGQVRYRKEGHGQREVTEGPLGYLHSPYDHYGFSQGIAHWIARHNRYSSDEVELVRRLRTEPLALRETLARDPIVRRRALKRLAARVPARPLVRFLYLYIWRLGFLDGYAGFVFCQLRLTHEIHLVAKLAEAEAAASSAAASPVTVPTAIAAGSHASEADTRSPQRGERHDGETTAPEAPATVAESASPAAVPVPTSREAQHA